MKTKHAFILGCSIILGFGLHAFMNRYEHSSGGDAFPYTTSRLNKLTGTLNYFGLLPLKEMDSANRLQSVIIPMDIHEIKKDTTRVTIGNWDVDINVRDIKSYED
jgi:hypothetical protein